MEEKDQKDAIKEWHKVLYKEREILIDEYREATRSFDQNMLTLSAGALGLSITFINFIAPTPHETTYVVYAWYFFISTLLSTLISFLTSQSACRKQMVNLDHMINASQVKSKCGWKYFIPWWMKKKKASCKDCYSRNCWANVTLVLNIISIILFILGVICFAIFAERSFTYKVQKTKEDGIVTSQNVNSKPTSTPSQTPQPSPTLKPQYENRGLVPQSTPPKPSKRGG